MKTLLSKYWKRILIFIAVVLIAMNIIHKTTAPHTLVEEFAHYGPTVAKMNTVDLHPSEIANEVRESAPVSGDILRIVIIFVVGLLAAVILSDLANKKAAPAKKK